MKYLKAKAFGGILFLVIVLGLSLFLPNGSLEFWQAWVYLILFVLSTGAITVYLMTKDPALLERRVAAGPVAEKETAQKIIQFLAQFAFIAIFIVAAFDHQAGWSKVPMYIIILGDVLVVGGLYIVFLVFKENTFTSATIEIAKDQQVISTGPYALVRHPMYTGALLFLLGTPLALGSFWGVFMIVPMAFVIVARLLAEEKFLSTSLPGYSAYCLRLRWRLIPGIF